MPYRGNARLQSPCGVVRPRNLSLPLMLTCPGSVSGRMSSRGRAKGPIEVTDARCCRPDCPQSARTHRPPLLSNAMPQRSQVPTNEQSRVSTNEIPNGDGLSMFQYGNMAFFWPDFRPFQLCHDVKAQEATTFPLSSMIDYRNGLRSGVSAQTDVERDLSDPGNLMPPVARPQARPYDLANGRPPLNRPRQLSRSMIVCCMLHSQRQLRQKGPSSSVRNDRRRDSCRLLCP